MATLLQSESRRLYSWWWDSHISPRNSKWLQENLTDMDAKVKAMIKLIEEDADSFARRAEMYYKKRPELMKLVEEFYRAYRALAERYDHATVELRQAHRTMAEAFPNQVPGELAEVLTDYSQSSCKGPDGGPQTPEMPHPVRALLDPDDLQKDALGLSSANLHVMNGNGGCLDKSKSGIKKRGLKQVNEMFGSRVVMLESLKVAEEKMKDEVMPQKLSECEIEKLAETEVETLKKTIAEILAEKEAVLLQYQESLQKLSRLEKELKDVGVLDERACRAEIEIKILRETLVKLEAERDAGLLQYNMCLQRISSLENTISQTQDDAKRLGERAMKAEIETQNLKQLLSKLEAEKEAGLIQHSQCLETLSNLENKISQVEENARALNEQAGRAEAEVNLLKQALHKLNEEKEAAELRYEQCMERINIMEYEISHAQEDVTRLNNEILTGLEKLRTAQEQCSLLEGSNASLHQEADNLARKIALKDQELSEKEDELEKLQSSLKDEHSQYVQIEVTLQALQKLHCQCQEEQKSLVIELKNRLQMLKDLETCNHDLQGDLQLAKEENQSLKELNSSSITSITNMQNEVFSLKSMKEKLEEEVKLQVAQSDSLQQEIYHLSKEIEGLNRRYQALVEQVHLVGLNPDCLASSVKDLQDENTKLKEVCKNDKDEKEVLYEKLRDMNAFLEKKVTLERSLSDVSGKLEASREKVNELRDSCQLLQEEKSSLSAEKAILLSQLQIMTENMQKLLEKNSLLENSLSSASFELECLRIKSKGLEELCKMLKNDKSYLQSERTTLATQLENVQQRLGNLESRFTRLEEKYTDLEKEKESSISQVKEIWGYISVEKHDHAYCKHSTESRLSDLENQVHLLQQDRRLSKKDFEEELDKAVNSQVEIFILQNFIHDLKEKNLSLLTECQKHAEGSKLSKKLISELEIENLEQQVEVEFLLDEIEKLRIGLHQVFRELKLDLVDDLEHGIKEQIPPSSIFDNIENLKVSYLKNQDEMQQLVVENLVLCTLLGQLQLEGVEMESEKKIHVQEFMTMTGQCSILQKDKLELLEMNKKLRLEVSNCEMQEVVLRTQLETQHVDLLSLQGSYLVLQEENLKGLEENRSLLQKFLDLQGEIHTLEEENCSILQKAIALDNLSLVLQSFGTEKVEELNALSQDKSCLDMMTRDFKQKTEILGEKLDTKEVEIQHLNEIIDKLHQGLHEGEDLIYQLQCQILIVNIFLRQKAMEVLQAEEKYKAMCNFNAELVSKNEELKWECEESKATREHLEQRIFELSKDSMNWNKEIARLNEANENLESEVSLLRREVEQRRTREESLTLELQERSNELGLWEAEASSFYFDLQITSIREVLLENKVHELTATCDSLNAQNATKDIEIERMKERSDLLESEVGESKAQLSAYVPIIASLRDDIESLEHNSLHRTKHFAVTNQASMGEGMKNLSHEMLHQELIDNDSTQVADGISDLMEMQTRIKAIDKAVVEEIERLQMQDTQNAKQEASFEGTKQWELRVRLNGRNDMQKEEMQLGNEFARKPKLQKNQSEISETRNGTLMKDIQLDQASDSSTYKKSKRQTAVADDQMLGLWEYVEQDCSPHPVAKDRNNHVTALLGNVGENNRFEDAKQKKRGPSSKLMVEKEVGIDKLEVCTNSITQPNQEGTNILERLASDAQKLMSLQTSVQVLQNKMQVKKRGKKVNHFEQERLKKELQGVEKSVAQLVDAYGQLTKNIEECPLSLEGNASLGSEEASNGDGNGATELAQNWFEKLGRLQFEVQSIQNIILKLEDEKKNKGKLRFPGSRTSIIFRDFIYGGTRSGRSRKKACFCGCARPSTHED